MTGLFTLGFGTVFTILGLAASAIGQAAFDNQADADPGLGRHRHA